MKVVLVKPPEICRFNFGTYSLGVLAASIRRMCDVSIVDASSLPQSEAIKAVRSQNPDMIGVTVMGFASVRPAAQFINGLRYNGQSGRRVTILAGGHGASTLPLELLEAGADAVVMGEGELTLRHILAGGIRPGMPGAACMVDGRLIIGPLQPLIRPLDSLSPPTRDLMPPPVDGVHLMETSRGCPHSCSFCETTRFYGQRWRPYSPQRVAAEIQRLVEDYDAWIIQFADDNFAANKNRVLEICKIASDGPLPAFILASARGDDLIADPRLIPAMASARILRVTVGVETLEPEVAGIAGKPIPMSTYREAFRYMQEHGMFTCASLIVGLPGESQEARESALAAAVEAGPDSVQFLPFVPLPGTPAAAGRHTLRSDPADLRDSYLLTEAFFRHPVVRKRLVAAAAGNGVRGLLARATLERVKKNGFDA